MKELSRSRWREATVQLGNSQKGTDDSSLRWTVKSGLEWFRGSQVSEKLRQHMPDVALGDHRRVASSDKHAGAVRQQSTFLTIRVIMKGNGKSIMGKWRGSDGFLGKRSASKIRFPSREEWECHSQCERRQAPMSITLWAAPTSFAHCCVCFVHNYSTYLTIHLLSPLGPLWVHPFYRTPPAASPSLPSLLPFLS